MSNPTDGRLVRLLIRIVISLFAVAGVFVGFLGGCAWMPGSADVVHHPPRAETSTRLKRHVAVLATPRNDAHIDGYRAAQAYIVTELREMGLTAQLQPVATEVYVSNNVWVEIAGEEPGLVIVGAHYDSAHSTPGADDNASGVAVNLELIRHFTSQRPKRTVRFVFFANEEPPHFRTSRMGSAVAAKALRDSGTDVTMMFSLEMLGYFDSTPGSQSYPPVLSWFYPDTGDFIAFVGNLDYRSQTRRAVELYRKDASVVGVGFSGPDFVKGIDFSDHMPFWNAEFPAVMVTDTSFFRNPNYHKPSDTPDTLNYVMMAKVVESLAPVIAKY